MRVGSGGGVKGQVDAGGERGGGAEHEQLLLQVGRLDDRFLRVGEPCVVEADAVRDQIRQALGRAWLG